MAAAHRSGYTTFAPLSYHAFTLLSKFMSHLDAAEAMLARLAQVCILDLSAGVTSLLVTGASTKNPTRTMVTLLVPMKISPRCMLSKLGQQVSKPQLVIPRFRP